MKKGATGVEKQPDGINIVLQLSGNGVGDDGDRTRNTSILAEANRLVGNRAERIIRIQYLSFPLLV